MTANLDLVILGKGFVKLLIREAGERLQNTVAAAIATVFCGKFVKNIVFNALHHTRKDILVRHTAVDKSRNVTHEREIFLDFGNGLFICKGKKLNEDTARRTAGKVGIHENAERANGRDLFALHVVRADIFGDFTRYDLGKARLRVADTLVADDAEVALTDDTANIKLAVWLQRKIGVGILDIALGIAHIVGNGNDRACNAVALEFEGKTAVFLFEHRTHEGGTRHDSAECGGRRGCGIVITDGGIHHFRRIDDKDSRRAVLGHGAENIVFLCHLVYLRNLIVVDSWSIVISEILNIF